MIRPDLLRRLDRWPWQLGALVACYLPWIANRAAALTANAYDLAEWTSLHPAVRGASIPLVAPFLLRAVLGGLALLFGFRALRALSGWLRLVYAALALILALTLLPPLEFFRGAWDDSNYRQQFFLSVGTLIGLGALAAAGQRFRTAPHLLRRTEAIVSALALLSGLIGEFLAQNVIRSLKIDAPLGMGVVLLVICLGVGSLAALRAATDSADSQLKD
jgi:purine-cytosine permease-like protein